MDGVHEVNEAGATITNRPMWLKHALEHIDGIAPYGPNTEAERNPATGALFIVNPLSGGNFGALLSTRRPVRDGIARLHAMARAQSPWRA